MSTTRISMTDLIKAISKKNIHNSDLIVLKYFIEQNKDNVDVITNPVTDGITLLMSACDFGHMEVVELLIPFYDAHQINSQADEESGYTALLMATWHGHLNVVKRLLAVPGVDINVAVAVKSRDSRAHGDTPLIAAVFKDHIHIVRHILTVDNVNVSMQRSIDGMNALNRAIVSGYFNMIAILLKASPISDITENVLVALKPKKEKLFDAILKLPKSDQLEIMKQIIEGKDQTVFGKVFRFGHTDVSKGRLHLVYHWYQELMRAELSKMDGNNLSAANIQQISAYIENSLPPTVMEKPLYHLVFFHYLNQLPADQLTETIIVYLKVFKNELLDEINKLADKDALVLLEKVFDESREDKKNDTTALGKLFWAGHPSLESGRLGAAYKRYQTLRNPHERKPTLYGRLYSFVKAEPEKKVTLGEDGVMSSKDAENAQDFRSNNL